MSLAVGLISVPILAKSLGRDAYGVWLLMGQAISYLALVDFGNASIAKLKLATPGGDDEIAAKQDVLSATLLGVLVTTPLVAVGGSLIGAWLTLRYADAQAPAASIAATVALLIGTFIAMRLASIPTFALFGANMEYRSAFTRMLITTANSVLDILVALFGFGMIGLACNRLMAQVALGLNLQWSAKRYVPWYGFTAFDWSKLAPLLKQNAFCLFAQWGNTLVEAVDILVVGLAVGAEAVPVYTITSALPRLLFMLFTQAMSGANAGLVNLFASGDRTRFHFVRTQQEIVTWACLAVVGATALAVNGDFVRLWIGPQYYGGTKLTAVCVAWYFSVITCRHYGNALSAALDFSRMARVQVVAGLVGLAAGIAGGNAAGVAGAIAGLTVVRMVANFMNSTRLDSLLGVATRNHLSMLALPVFVALACCCGGWIVGGAITSPGWVETAFVGSTAMLSAGAAAWVLGVPPAAKRDLASRLSRLSRILPGMAGARPA